MLDAAIREINESSDIIVGYEEKRVNRKLTHLRFFGEKKKDEVQEESAHVQQMRAIGFPDKKIKDLSKAHSEEDIVRALAFLIHFTKTTKEPVKNPVALFNKALIEGWCKPMSEPTLDLGTVVEPIIAMPGETGDVGDIRRALMADIGQAEYASWFAHTKITLEDGGLVVTCSSEFIRDAIDVNYKHRLQRVVPEGIVVSIAS